MNHCLRCKEPCGENSQLCDRCRSQSEDHSDENEQREKQNEKQKRGKRDQRPISERTTLSLAAVAVESARTAPLPVPEVGEGGTGAPVSVLEPETADPDTLSIDDHDTQPVPVQVAPGGPIVYVSSPDPAELALHRLNDAARLIASEEPQVQANSRAPRASRLTPFYDISADIRRDSTPLPRTTYSTQPGKRSTPLPDLWPWISAESEDEGEKDLWSGLTDPLQARRLPSSLEMSRVGNADRSFIARTFGPRLAALRRRPARPKVLAGVGALGGRWRLIFLSLSLIAILALALDISLVWFALKSPTRNPLTQGNALPTLTLEFNTVQYGQKMKVHIRHFTPNGRASLTRDLNVPLIKAGNPYVLVDDKGALDFSITIDNSWDPGLHSVQAEDIRQRFTANATLRIDAGPTRPPHLLVSTTNLDLGSGYEGANTVQPLTLENGGSGMISWSATSDQPWLTLSPSRGSFSDTTHISVGGSRVDLVPQDYTGTITITANGEEPQVIHVKMTVSQLPTNAGAVLAVSPATLEFTAVDGEDDPEDQYLIIRNPGSQPLYWTILENPQSAQDMSASADFALDANWLRSDKSGIVPAQSQATLRISVHSGALLPGTYMKTLLFGVQKNHKALNAPTPVNVSLTVTQSCGIDLHGNTLHFTAVAQHGNPSPQSLNLTASDSCKGTIPWTATPSTSWLTLTPTQGAVSIAMSSVLTVGVDVSDLKASNTPYQGFISLHTNKSTQTIAVEVTVQPPPAASEPMLGAAPLSLNFAATMGQQNLAGQAVTLTNTGGGTLRWRTSVTVLASSWLGASPTGGTIEAGKTAQLMVNVSALNLAAGSYAGQVEIHAFDEQDQEISGSPQIVAINLVVRPLCAISTPSSTSLSFTETGDGSNPAPQSITFSASGDCSWPLNWNATVQTANASWLKLSPASGSFAAESQPTTLTFAVDSASLSASSSRRVSVQIGVTDQNGQAVQGGSQTISVSLVKPCGLQMTPGNLDFVVKQGQTSTAQSLDLSTVGSCKLPLSWSASVDSSWITLSASSGSYSGDAAALDVSAKATSLGPGSYNGTITFSAQDSSGAIVHTVTIAVTLRVNGFALGGTVNACPDTTCAAPSTLAGATVTLSAGGRMVGSVIADAQGRYSFTNLAAGSYTLTASGSSGGTSYTGSVTVPLSADATSTTINAISASTPT